MELWGAGQARLARENRQRMTELYVAGRDAYVAGNVATKKVEVRGTHQAPPYTTEFSRAKPQTAGEYRATLARLSALAPGRVTRSH